MRIGLVGYGNGGRYFHAPFIRAAKGCELVGIVARSPDKIRNAEADFPGVKIYPSLTAMIEAGVEAVTITTPPETRRELVLEAISAGVAVVADKPFAPNAEAGRELDAAAEANGVILSVFQNRRYDADIRTLRHVLDSGKLGRLWRVHSRMDLDEQGSLDGGPTGGLLRDLGSHLVDQALWLLGPATSVHAQLDMVDRPQGLTDAGFVVAITHANGVVSHLSASKLNRLVAREFRAYGEDGSYVSNGTDVQATAIFAGLRPSDDLEGWGYEKPEFWGTLRIGSGVERVPSEPGRYHEYYESFARAVIGGDAPPVPAKEAVKTLAVLDAARLSATENRVIQVPYLENPR